MPNRNPIRLGMPLKIYEVDAHRHPDCSFQNKCLGKAARKNWKSFSCIDCPEFKRFLKKRKKEEEKKRKEIQKNEKNIRRIC